MRGMAMVLAALCCAVAGSVHAQVDVEPYVKSDVYTNIRISPGGDYYAALRPLEDHDVLVIIRRSDSKLMAKLGGQKNSAIANFWWVNDQNLVVAMAEQFGKRDTPGLTGDLYGVGADGSRPRLLIGPGVRSGNDALEAAYMLDTLANDDTHVLVAVCGFEASAKCHAEKLDIVSARRVPVMSTEPPVKNSDFVTDRRGQVRFAYGLNDDNYNKLYYRADDASPWRLLNDQAQSHRVLTPLGFSADGIHAWLQETGGQGPDAIIEWNSADDTRREVLRDATVDPHDIIRDANGVPVGAHFMHERMTARFFDETSPTARAWRTLEKAFGGLALDITSSTRDGKLQVIRAWDDRSPGDFYLFDAEHKHAEHIAGMRDWFDPERTATTREIEVKARDGMQLHGYLTVAAGIEAKNMPMVVLPHGGPYGIFDEWGFDEEAQLLAQAGYAVLRLNYRGSGNYGYAYEVAGAQEWGGAMQDDLTDATHWAITQRIADPKRICIYGASYGGYAALMGAAKESDLYRCAVGYAGVYDLELMHKQKSRMAAWLRSWADDWVGARGELADVSPVNFAAKIKVPVFLAAGGDDERVPIEHSRKMEKALRAANVPVETLYYDHEGHGFYTEAHRREFYAKLLDFLSRNIGGQPALAQH